MTKHLNCCLNAILEFRLAMFVYACLSKFLVLVRIWFLSGMIGQFTAEQVQSEKTNISSTFWTPGLPEGVLSNRPCPCVCLFVFKYLRDGSLVFSSFFHEFRAP